MSGLMPASTLLPVTRRLRAAVQPLGFAESVTHVYNPLDYAWEVHRSYLKLYGQGTRKFILLGMNPGPWGMAQTGIPFGDVGMVRDWLGLSGRVAAPAREHPRRPGGGYLRCRSESYRSRGWEIKRTQPKGRYLRRRSKAAGR